MRARRYGICEAKCCCCIASHRRDGATATAMGELHARTADRQASQLYQPSFAHTRAQVRTLIVFGDDDGAASQPASGVKFEIIIWHVNRPCP